MGQNRPLGENDADGKSDHPGREVTPREMAGERGLAKGKVAEATSQAEAEQEANRENTQGPNREWAEQKQVNSGPTENAEGSEGDEQRRSVAPWNPFERTAVLFGIAMQHQNGIPSRGTMIRHGAAEQWRCEATRNKHQRKGKSRKPAEPGSYLQGS